MFFGGARNSRHSHEGNATIGEGDNSGGVPNHADADSSLIDACTDAFVLLNGISQHLQALISQTQLQHEDVQQPTDGVGAPPLSAPNTEGQTPVETTATTDASVTASILDKIAARLSRLRFLLYDERRVTSQQPQHLMEKSKKMTPVIAETTVTAITGNQIQHVMPALLEHMNVLPFESRKHVAAIFNYLLICGLEGIDAPIYIAAMTQFVSYVEANYDQIMTHIVQGHDVSRQGITSDIVLHFGSMYRSCTRHPILYQQLVGTRERAERFVYPFLDEFVHMANFEISSDAMESLRAAFAATPDRSVSNNDEKTNEQWNRSCISDIAAEFLNRDYEALWDDRFTPKLLSNTANYMSRRVALQILSTVLLTRSNYSVMIRYVASRSNLIVVMHLLRDTSPHITLDAFHVFKVFVANPNKPPEIVKILHDNKSKLCTYLTTLHQEKEENDTQFRDEKALIISTIDAQ